MKRFKRLCGAVLIAGFMLPQIVLGSTDTAEAASGKWKQTGKKWWYSYSDGTYPKSKWEKIGGKWYHFDKSGYMQTGWQKISGKWYYFGSNGIMKTGWQKISGKWYYFDGSGAMVTGTKTIGGKSYTFGSDGVMKEGSSGSSSGIKVGDTIKFGHYEQDNHLYNGKESIEWLVLDKKQDGSLLVISKYALDCQPYNTKRTDVTWETCTLRKWLNSTFLKAAFSAEDQKKIVQTTVVNADNSYYGTNGGANTKDWIFLLSIDEACKYFVNDDGTHDIRGKSHQRACTPTAYAIAQGAFVDSGNDWYNGNCWWRLRSPGVLLGAAALVVRDGYVNVSGNGVSVDQSAVRPAMWIKP